MPASEGIDGYGTKLTGSLTGEIGQVTRISVSDREVKDIDISTMQSPEKWMEYIAGMKDANDIQVDLLYEPNQTATVLAALGGPNENWTITYPDNSTFVCEGYIRAQGEQIPMDDKITQRIVIKLSGEPQFTPGS